jgi:hypothetical protein
MRLKRDESIRREHSFFSGYARASFSGNPNAIASSLIIGDDFIHSYNFGIHDDDSFLILQTYSKHGNGCYHEVFVGSLDIAQETQSYLTVRVHHDSSIFQKCSL